MNMITEVMKKFSGIGIITHTEGKKYTTISDTMSVRVFQQYAVNISEGEIFHA